MLQGATVLASLALIALGAVNLIWQDPLLQWQPMAPGSVLRRPLAIVSGAALLIGGALMLFPGKAKVGATIAACWILMWTLALQFPAALAGSRPLVVGLLGFAECLAMALGLATLARPWFDRAWWRAAFGLCLMIFGLSHFMFAEFTAAMVPAWLPARLGIAYLTGAIHAAAGVAIIAGFAAPLATAVEAMMMTSFVLLLHVPRVIIAPGDRTEITMLAIALMLSAATWLVAVTAFDQRPVKES